MKNGGLINKNNDTPTKAIRNLGKVLVFKFIALNKISCKLKINHLKPQTTHSQTVSGNPKKNGVSHY